MGSWNNRRIRRLHRRHARTRQQICDRIRSLTSRAHDPQFSAEERKPLLKRLGRAVYQLEMLDNTFTDRFPKASKKTTEPVKRPSDRPGHTRRSLDLKPTSVVLEKEAPKVHGVNAQRENRTRPKVGGARGRNPGAAGGAS